MTTYDVTRVIGYVGRSTSDRRTLTSVWVRDMPLPVLAYRVDGGHEANGHIGFVRRVRFESDGRIVAEMCLDEPEPDDQWPVLDLGGLPNDGTSFRRGRFYMSGEIVSVTYTSQPAWPKIKDEPR